MKLWISAALVSLGLSLSLVAPMTARAQDAAAGDTVFDAL